MDCPQEEITGERPSNYSRWHRQALPVECYMTDGDWFEQRVKNRELVSVSYIETIQIATVEQADTRYPLWKSKKSLSLEIEEKMGIPAYTVWHNPDCTDFLVLRITETKPKRMNKDKYVEFIKNL